jgi:hypothetical protein
MATREDQPQPLVGIGIALAERRVRRFGVCRTELGQGLEGLALALQVRVAPEPVDGAVAGDRRDPGPGIVGDPLTRPPLDRRREGVLDGLLGEIEVAEGADQRCDRPPRLVPEQAVDIVCERTGRYEAALSFVCEVEPAAS